MLEPEVQKVEQLKGYIEKSDNIVFFGGAGVSTESGIPDFRSIDGLYHMKYQYPPETILSHTFFLRNTKEVNRYMNYMDRFFEITVQNVESIMI